jgi:hypothetical protein
MKAKARVWDAFGAAGVRELATESHMGYRILVGRLRADLVRVRQLLEGDRDPTETAKLRGEIKGLRTALEMPQRLLEEYEKGASSAP